MQGCATKTEYVYVKPHCNIPQLGELPQIDAGELYNLVGSTMYLQLEDRETQIVTWGLRLEAIAKRVCE